MFPIVDWLMILITTIVTYKSYKKLVFDRYCSVSFYVVFIVYIFCCVPIILNYLIGMPQYTVVYWYKAFVEPMNNVDVSAVYDIYITFAILALYIYGTKMNRRLVSRATERNSVLRNENEKPWIYVFGIASPVLYVLLSGNVSKFLIYSSMNLRGVSGQDNLILNSLILVSLFCTCIMLFSGRITAKKMCILALITFILAWLQGKRFIIAVMGVFYLFFLTKSELEEKGRKRTFWILPIMVITLIAFSAFYLAVIKPLSNMNFDSVYDMLRVDFGRDDVIKYVIYKEFFKQNHILDYPGQSFFSTLFIFIPRIIWPSKPYSHYQYLTSSILNLPISKLPAGTTPCWYEMTLCNFGYLGYLVGIFGLIIFCYFADTMKQTKSKSLVFMFILVLLTQNTDVYVVYILLIFMYYLKQRIKHPKIVFRIGRK
ncbi:hypothetical protein [Blautia massiliensis (ex Durand et al. 2017)]|uniref:hypothetical protein n=1 Tax=Blautia massiliensis (ex Durand et al. 2017) TaxID=1737424 RepID=UPI000E4BF72C|nr:hypothetical protein [Blautia massiliensis (ex Durand et al. 2017)]RHP74548.1 hypothetical protein DXA48_05780 [Ruminococcus sp. OF02-6]